MVAHEVMCFSEKLPSNFDLSCHSIVQGPWTTDVLRGVDAVMVGGSGDYGSADNKEPWFPSALAFLRLIVEQGLPLFCSCWGHQALACAFGGKVIKDPLGYELGLLPVELTQGGKTDRLFSSLPDPFITPLGHCEQVVELPEEAILLASNARCRVQAFRLKGKPVYGTQFHPELTSQQMWDRVDAYIPHLDDADARSRPQSACTDTLVPQFLQLFV